jgi:Family of unknown function (DUF5329)
MMKPKGIALRLMALTVLGATVASSGLARSSCLPTGERQRLETLIGNVEQRSDATFIRNGRSYDAVAGAQFLRGKWRNREAEVCSAEDFIAKVASVSSTTGKPYLVRLRDGREVLAAEFFRAELARLTGDAGEPNR